MDVRYQAFGELQVSIGGTASPINRRRERQALATLIACRDGAVAADRMVTDLWGEDAPPSALSLVQVAVSRLRSLIEPDRTQRGGRRIVSTTAGYTLRAAADEVDVWRFEDLARRALDESLAPAEVAATCQQVAELWSEPYAGVEAPEPRRHAERLRELRTDVLAQHARALLDLGTPGSAVRLLSTAVEEHPYREQLWGLLARAQCRAGRQADALATLRRLRRALAEDLGVDPASATTELEQALLRQDATELARPLLRTAPSPPARTVSHPTHVVGRDAEIAAATAVLQDAVVQDQARFLLVVGEPGIGKTTFLGQVAATAGELGYEVLVGRNYEDDLAPALWPWAKIVRPILDEAPDPLRELLLPVFSDEAPARQDGGPMLRTYDAVVELLTQRAHRGPLLLVIEDLHNADTATLRLLRHLTDSQPGAPIVLAASKRTTEDPTPALLASLAALSRAGVTQVRLGGLAVEAVAELIGTVAGRHAERLDQHVTTLTSGNPFFVRQYAALLAARDDLLELDPATLEVPHGIRAVLRERLHRLPEDAREVLLAAAVLGPTIEPDLLACVTDRPTGDVLAALDVGTAAGLVVEEGARFRFVHALAVRTSYGELSAARRIRMHDRAGRALEEQRGADADLVNAISLHAWAALSLSAEHRERAATWRARAAEAALVHHAYEEALTWWRDVLTIVPAKSLSAALAHRGVGTALLNLSRRAEAQQEIDAAIAIARETEAWTLISELATAQAVMGPWSWPTPGPHQTAFTRALAETLPHVDDASRALLHAIQDVDRHASGHPGPRGADSQRAVELARQVGDLDLLRHVLVFAVMGTAECWPPPRRLGLVRELLSLEPVGDMLAGTHFLTAVVEWENRRPDRADASMAACAALTQELRFGQMFLPLAWWDALRARDRDAPEADQLLDHALELHRRSGSSSVADTSAVALARRNGGRDLLAGLVDLPAVTSPVAGAVLAHALLEAGEPELARAHLDAALPPDAPLDGRLAVQCLRLLTLAGVGSPAEVRAALAVVEPHRGRTVTVLNVVDHCGVVDHFLAAGYAALGDPRARELAASAVQGNEQLGCRPWWRRSAALLARLDAVPQPPGQRRSSPDVAGHRLTGRAHVPAAPDACA